MVFKLLISTVLLTTIMLACSSNQNMPSHLEQRATNLNKVIMCPVCPGESVDQSQNALAVQMRGIVDKKLKQGWTDQQIKNFFVERYGISVLLEPPREGISLVVWIVPPIGILTAALLLAGVLKAMRNIPKPRTYQKPKDSEMTAEERDLYFSKIKDVLKGTSKEPTS